MHLQTLASTLTTLNWKLAEIKNGHPNLGESLDCTIACHCLFQHITSQIKLDMLIQVLLHIYNVDMLKQVLFYKSNVDTKKDNLHERVHSNKLVTSTIT